MKGLGSWSLAVMAFFCSVLLVIGAFFDGVKPVYPRSLDVLLKVAALVCFLVSARMVWRAFWQRDSDS